MKNLIKWFMVPFLGVSARAVIRRYKPQIVMVTGSVGKTSTKDAVAAVLAPHFFMRKSEKSFNSELGVPFTILGVENPWGNPIAWLKVVKATFSLLFLPNHYPNMLVLEVGADHPGDLAGILKICSPDAVVVTRLPEIPVHVEAYASPEEVREEEFSPATALTPSAPLILCADDPYAIDAGKRVPARVISYGLSSDATIRLSDVDFHTEEKEVTGMSAKVHIGDDTQTLVVKGSIGLTQLLPAAAALAMAEALQIPIVEAMASLLTYEPPAGRGRLIGGVRGSIIIDDSYNASPAAVEEALTTLQNFPGAKRRIAILGDMLELGRYSAVEHERIGVAAGKAADLVIAVGIRARAFITAAPEAEVVLFDDSKKAAVELISQIQEGDVVLIKGSQSIRMERIAQALLADPMDFKKLVRQEKEWKKR